MSADIHTYIYIFVLDNHVNVGLFKGWLNSKCPRFLHFEAVAFLQCRDGMYLCILYIIGIFVLKIFVHS
jgi:hypothetical protein